jgi:phytoene synthase
MTDALVTEGYVRAKAITRHHAKSFFFASVALFGERRRAAFALYAFCRRLDDMVDGDNTGDGLAIAPTLLPSELPARLALARASVSALYGTPSNAELMELPWHPAEFAAFRDTVARYRIPELPFQELINGMEMDLTKSRYANFEELRLYCHRVAGVVGLMMTPVLGHRDDRCLPYAADLGIAMQLTNILRDVKEDLSRGRVYLPADELARFGITEAELARGEVTDAWRGFAKFQIARAREFYQRAELGIPDLQGFGSQRVVRLMSTIYGNINSIIEARDYDVFSQRARVSFGGKLRLAAGVMVTPNPSQRLLSAPQGDGA